MDVQVNYLAVLLAGLSSMIVGAIFYAKPVLGLKWSKLAKVDLDAPIGGSKLVWKFGTTFVASLVTAYVLAHVTFLSNSFFQNSFTQDALTTAFWLWLGFTIARIYVHDTFEQRRKMLTVLAGAYELITIIIMALIIGAMGV